MEFVKKPIAIQAFRWEGNNTKLVKQWLTEQWKKNAPGNSGIPANFALFVPRRSTGMTETLWQNIADPEWSDEITAAVFDYLHESYVGVKTGQWIMCGTEGEYYPCADDGTGKAPLNYGPAILSANEQTILEELSNPHFDDQSLSDLSKMELKESDDGDMYLQTPGHTYVDSKEKPTGIMGTDKPLDDHRLIKDQMDSPPPVPLDAGMSKVTAPWGTLVASDGHVVIPEGVQPQVQPWMLPFMEWVLEYVDVLDFEGVPVPVRLRNLIAVADGMGALND